jgi:hypothetical protein
LADVLRPPAALADVSSGPATPDAPPDDFQRAVHTLAIIVGDSLDRSEADLAESPVLPMRLVDTTQPAPSSAEQAAEATERFRDRARQHR